MKKNRGLSPVIATVLLVAMVIVMGTVVFIWMKGSIKEVIYKFSDKNIELSCADVKFDFEYYLKDNFATIYVVNNGDVPIKDFRVQVSESGTKTTFNLGEKDLSESAGTKFSGISSGSGEEINVVGKGIPDASEVLLIPILQGTTKSGITKNYVCDEQYGERRYGK